MSTLIQRKPVSRRLRVFAFDPSLATRIDTSTVNQLTLSIPWEDLEEGPVGEYVEVIDHDPASGVFYRPVDLDDPHLLAQDGLAPSESNPQFHQQMVYAIAMTTIRRFERALGRVAFWADHTVRPRGRWVDQFVRRLRIYPHALRDRNAYYSPGKKSLLFGYFPVSGSDASQAPGTMVFTCLSHDIIAHEVAHALLDGIHSRYNEATNPDVLAFHEAFSDIVALFQHFSFPAVLESQVRRTRGQLDSENLLSQLAQQFGVATGRGAALRDALGSTAEDGSWRPKTPDPRALSQAEGPHARGSILVAAVFRAFLLIYRERSADLFRIATQGTGTLPEGDIHPDLTRRLAAEASRCADRILQMCIRALDYCPPLDITFGAYLRAVVTADLDHSPEDESGFRLVFLQSFREWGIHPRGVTGIGQDVLEWPRGDDLLRSLEARRMAQQKQEERQNERERAAAPAATRSQPGESVSLGATRGGVTFTPDVALSVPIEFEDDFDQSFRQARASMKESLRAQLLQSAPRDETAEPQTAERQTRGAPRSAPDAVSLSTPRAEESTTSRPASGETRSSRDASDVRDVGVFDWSIESDRFKVWQELDKLRWKMWRWLTSESGETQRYREILGLVFERDAKPTIFRGARELPAIEVHAVRPAVRRSPQGGPRTVLVVEVTQVRRGYFLPAMQNEQDENAEEIEHDFLYRAGVTLHLDPASQDILRVIRTRGTIADDEALDRLRRFLTGEIGAAANAFDAGLRRQALRSEPFALLHDVGGR